MARAKAKAKQGVGGAIPHTVTAAEVAAMPAAVGLQAGDEILLPAVDDGVPTYTIRADSQFGMDAMIAINRLADTGRTRLDPDELALLTGTVREFELFEERSRS